MATNCHVNQFSINVHLYFYTILYTILTFGEKIILYNPHKNGDFQKPMESLIQDLNYQHLIGKRSMRSDSANCKDTFGLPLSKPHPHCIIEQRSKVTGQGSCSNLCYNTILHYQRILCLNELINMMLESISSFQLHQPTL